MDGDGDVYTILRGTSEGKSKDLLHLLVSLELDATTHELAKQVSFGGSTLELPLVY